MDDDGKPCGPGDLYLPPEHRLLNVSGRIVPVKVETYLSVPDNLGMSEISSDAFLHRIRIGTRVVRVDADGPVHVGIARL